MADSSSPVSAFSARCDRNSTIAATISASAPNRPSSALTKTCGWPLNESESAPANALTRFSAYRNRSPRAREPGNSSSRPQPMSVPTAMPATSAAAALNSAPRRTLAQNSLRASTRNRIAATWKPSPITSPMSSMHRFVAGDQVDDVPADGRDHVEDQNPPGDAFAGGQRRRQQGQHERPREAGVGEVEDVVVDELARLLDEPPDARRDAGYQGQSGDDADRPAGRRRHPRVPGGLTGQGDGHTPRGYSLKPGNCCDAGAR